MANDILLNLRLNTRPAVSALDVFKGALASVGVVKILQGITKAAGDVSGGFLEFSSAVAEINSILPVNEKVTLRSKNAFLEFSNSFAGTPQKQAKAFYAIVSAGVQTTAKQLETLAIANKAAVAGLVDIDVAAGVLVSSVNAYANSALTAEEASDVLFIAVREGQTTFGELASTLGSVAPLAAAAGIRFDELAGTLAFITKSGVSTTEAVTGLRGVIAGLIKPSEGAKKAAEELNIELSTKGIAAAGGLAAFFEKLKVATGGSEVALAKLFPNIQALSAVINITRGNFADFRRILSETADAAGTTEAAFKIISQSAGFQFERLTQELQNLPQAFLVNFEEPIADAIKAIREFVGGAGILLITGAINIIIESIKQFQIALGTLPQIVSFASDALLGMEQKFIEFNLATQEAIAATKGFFGLDISENEKFLEAIRARIQAIKDERQANEEATLLAQQELDTKIEGLEAFQQKIDEGRARELEANKSHNDQLVEQDKQKVQKQIAIAQEKDKKLEALRQEVETLEEERRLIKDEQNLLEADKDFEFLEERLGRSEALRQTARIKAAENDKKADEIRLKAKKKAINAEIKQEANKAKFSDLTRKQQLKQAENTADLLLQVSKNASGKDSKFTKTVAISKATISGFVAIQKALEAPFPLNIVNSALVAALTAQNISKITSTPTFQEGGIVPGSQFTGDNVLARVNSGELILNRAQQENLAEQFSQQTNVTIQGNVMADDDEQVDILIDRIRDAVEFRNQEITATRF